ncbi:uncharacterized protein L199_006933 [Kwoniella botswanensis]|uniref:uncharacterized protein n=1 Tax=Kwoniella botswanensis TaxID=1268659 RepID=UPI00315C82F9
MGRPRTRKEYADEEIPRNVPPLASAPPRSMFDPEAGSAYFVPPSAPPPQANQVADMFTMMGNLLRNTSTGSFSQNTTPVPNSTYGLQRDLPQSFAHSGYPTNNMWSAQGDANFPSYNSGYGSDIVDLSPDTMYTPAHRQPLSTQNLDYFPGVRGYGNQPGTPTQGIQPMSYGDVAIRSAGSSRPLRPAVGADDQNVRYKPYSRAQSTTSSNRGGSKSSGKDQLTIIFTDPSGSKKNPGPIHINGRRKSDWDRLQDEIDMIVGRSRAVFSTEFPHRSESEAPPSSWGAIEYHYEGKTSASADLSRGLVRPDDVPRMKGVYQEAILLGKRIESGPKRDRRSRDAHSSTVGRSQGLATDTVQAWASGIPTTTSQSTPSISSIPEGATNSQGDAYSQAESETGTPRPKFTVLEGAIRPMSLDEKYDDD